MSSASDVPVGYGNYRLAAAGPPPPEGRFIVLPSPNGSLMVKSLAVRELVMPAESSSVEQQSQDCLDAMTGVLDKVCIPVICARPGGCIGVDPGSWGS